MSLPVTRRSRRRLSVAIVAAASIVAASFVLAPSAAAAPATVAATTAETSPTAASDLRADRAACTELVRSALVEAGRPSEVSDGPGSPLARCLRLASTSRDVSELTAQQSGAIGITPALPPGCTVAQSDRADAAAAINASLDPSSQPAERCAAVTAALQPQAGSGAASRDGDSVFAQAGGSISGTVTAAGVGGVSGICVSVFNFSLIGGGGGFGTEVQTVSGGAWTATELPPGSYRVYFNDCRTAKEYQDEYYDNTQNFDSARLIDVTEGSAATGINAVLEPGATVTGTVSAADAGGLAGICVSAFGRNTFAATTTDSTGAYRLGGLATDSVRISFSDCRGQAEYVEEYYNDARDLTLATSVSVTAGTTTSGINATLARGGAITGTVRDSQAPQAAIAGICVSSFPKDGFTGGNSTTTAADGTYRVGGLSAADHNVSFADCNADGISHLSENYDNVQFFSATQPTPVTVVGTSTTSNINAGLDRAGKITGRVVTDPGGVPLGEVCVYAERENNASFFFSDFAYTEPDGTYVMDFVYPGQHVVEFDDCTRREYVGEYYDNVSLRDVAAATRVTVTSGGVTSAIDAALLLGGKITGVTKNSRTGEAVGNICLFTEDGSLNRGFFGFGESAPDGAFTVGGLPTGSYALYAFDCGQQQTYGSQYYDRVQNILDATKIAVTQGQSTGPITVSMEPFAVGAGTISGVVTLESGAVVGGAYVYACASTGRCSSDTTDAQGQYQLTGLTDQQYRVVATPPPGARDLNSASVNASVVNEGPVTAPTLVLEAPVFPPSTTTVNDTPPGQTPVVVVGTAAPVTISAPPCTGGGEVTVTVTPVGGGTPYVVKFSESSPGSNTFSGDIVVPFTGPADVVISQAGCSGTIAFNIYIDPSGNVFDHAGRPVQGATVTLFRADTAAGPFTAVPEGSSLMDPSNRKNPDLTDAVGHFGWNVVQGYYKVRAEKAGCRSPQDHLQRFVDTQVYEIPPPVVDIKMVLDCRKSVALNPERLLDTRADGPQTGYTGSKPAAGRVVELQVTGRGVSQVPVDAAAVVLNVTGVGPASSSFVTVYPCGTTRPLASNLNLTAGEVRPNLVITKVGTGGKVCLFTQQSTDLIADVSGYYPAGTDYTGVNPERLLDTRADGPQTGYTGSKPAAGRVVELQVSGRGTANVPAGAGAVVLNVTGVGPTSDSFVTVYPCGTTRPLASNLNLVAGQVAPNLVITKLGAGGKVCLFTQQSTDLIADISGFVR